MGAGHSSRSSWPPPGSRRKHLLALLRINGHSSAQSSDVEVSQASEVICEILEHVFSFLTTSEFDDINNAQLVVVSRVNRHWNQVARRILYRRITLTSVRQLNLLVRTVDHNPSVRDHILRLSVPHQLQPEPARTHNAAGIRLSPDQVERERLQAQRAATTTLLHLLSKLPCLDALTLHAKSIMLLVHSAEGSIKPPPLSNLATIRKLSLLGMHDARWLFLLKYTTRVTSFRATPAWHASDDPVLPFSKWDLRELCLCDGVRLSLEHFQQLVSPPLSSPSSSSPHLRSLTLINVPTLFTSPAFEPVLTSLSPSLTNLTLSSSNASHLSSLTSTLTSVLPNMPTLTHLSTNTPALRTLSPRLHALTISLAQTPPSFYPPTSPPSTTTTRTSTPPSPTPNPTIGTIYETISGILCTLPTPPQTTTRTSLKRLTIIDAPLEDYLHFHLVGSHDWDTTEAGKQNRLWMLAGQLGVLTVVEKAVTGELSNRSSMGSSAGAP
ncbi:hypothetical protein FRB90_004257 [Tulasnella sp. 427]|nr:hypothetical protein FRB90_004257 [Tulasnella sp. 427]